MKKGLRPAIAMIELIFAIVVIGLVLMSAPMLMQTASKSGYVALQQEAINEAVTRVNMVTWSRWDENTTLSGSDIIDEPDYIVSVNHGDSELDINITTNRRNGTPQSTPSRSFANLNATVALGDETSDTIDDDIDDYIGTTHITLIESTSKDYIDKNAILVTKVSYINDSANYNQSSIIYNLDPGNKLPAGQTSNIKMVEVNLTSSSGVNELDKSIILRAFSCNTGDGKIFAPPRNFP